MAEQRQPFRFRLPWLSAPQPAPAAPRPSQATQAPSQPVGTQTQRPPFRPAGVAPPQPAKTEPPSSSQSSQGTSKPAQQAREANRSQGPPASPSQTSRPASPAEVSSKPQGTKTEPPPSSQSSQGTSKPAQHAREANRSQGPPAPPSQTSRPASPAEVSSKPQGTKALPQIPSPSRQTTQLTRPKASIPPPSTSSQAKPPTPTNRPPTVVSENSRNPTEIRQRENSKPPSELPKPAFEVLKTELAAEKPSPKQERKSRPVNDLPTSYREPKQLKGNYNRQDVIDKEVTSSAGTPFKMHKREKPLLMNEKPLSIITLTGENKGAIMHINSESQNKERPIRIGRGYKIKSEGLSENTNDSKGSSSNRKPEENIPEEVASKSYVNSNTQGINNSIVFNSSITERNPGVHMVVSRNGIEPETPGKERGTLLDTQKVQVSSTPAERHAYAPAIRRRCLRGLFLESSDEDPEKPRRHGCRVGCAQNESEF